mgnify:CR=1 FL=1
MRRCTEINNVHLLHCAPAEPCENTLVVARRVQQRTSLEKESSSRQGAQQANDTTCREGREGRDEGERTCCQQRQHNSNNREAVTKYVTTVRQ